MELRTALFYRAQQPRLWAIRQYAQHSETIQRRQLSRVLRCLSRTRYAADNEAQKISDYKSFNQALPIVEYETLRPYAEEMLTGAPDILTRGHCDRFAMSSGTSGGRSKFIPLNGLHLQAAHFQGGRDSLLLYLATRPDSRFFATKGLVLGGSQRPANYGGDIRVGDLSSILIEKMPAVGSVLRVPSKETLMMDEWNAKLECIAQEVACQPVGSLSGVPSWMLVLIKKLLADHNLTTLDELWPSLEVFFHGGISFSPYRQEYERLIPSPRMQYRETYNASEGFFAIQDDPADSAMLLMLDYGIFYEFIPLEELESDNPCAIPLWEVEIGKTYAMLISTLGGLYRYMIGDTVRFTQANPYKLVIVGRTTSYINGFGEELMVCNANDALRELTTRYGVAIVDYTAAPLFLTEEGKGRHQWVIEFATAPENVSAFARELDDTLRKLNSDYDAKRYSDMTLLPLEMVVAPEGTFAHYLEQKGKKGGQNKVPRLKNDRSVIDDVLALIR